MPPSTDPGRRASASSAAGHLAQAAAWWAGTVLLGVVSGHVFAAPEWTSPVVPALTLAGACVGLALGVVVGHLRVHRWWGIALVWVGFVVGMVPPLSEDDALWIIAAPVLGFAAAVYVGVVNLLLVQASSRRSRRRL